MTLNNLLGEPQEALLVHPQISKLENFLLLTFAAMLSISDVCENPCWASVLLKGGLRKF